MKKQNTLKLTITGLLIAIGIIIPMYSPARVVLPPASFTLASHAAIFIAMFISPKVAVAVAAGTTLGFLFGGFPIIIVFRAATHIIFAFVGAMYLRKLSSDLSTVKLRVFSFVIGIIHAVGEVVVVSIFFFGGSINAMFIEQGFVTSVLLLIGLGSVIHSMVDFEIARLVLYPLKKQRNISMYFMNV